ncbi:MAG: radical SAM protein, partial [Rhodocyclaceae bacterium]|nr:radical SAM protein [Rhodocyclaceae bacterium]
MFRISQFMQEIAAPTPAGPQRHPPGPVVIWNLIRRCNLTCKHCYSISADTDFAGELTTDEVFRVMDDLKACKVPCLILSGGEPLLRPDFFAIAQRIGVPIQETATLYGKLQQAVRMLGGEQQDALSITESISQA